MTSPRTSFLGEHPASLDPEGRILLPQGLRNVLNPERDDVTLMANLEPDGSVCVRETHAWQSWISALRAGSEGGSRRRRVLLFLAANSAPVKLDRQGRVRVPDPLLAKAGLDRNDESRRDVVVVGNFDDVRIWSPAGWRAFEESARAKFDEDLEQLQASRVGVQATA